jgi:hypothetical protein
MWRTTFGMARALALTFVMVRCSYPQTLKIWPGIAPGSETWTREERVEKNTPIGAVVFNVVTPTLTVDLPGRTAATGTGIIIAPGGAFVALAIDLEGHAVARWLQDKGIRKQGTSSDHWLDAFYFWLEARGFTKPAAR